MSIAVIGVSGAVGQSDDELRRELQEARERIRQLEMMSGDLPPMANSGECFSRVLVPPAPRTLTETIPISESRTETRIIPAVYGTVTEQVLVEPERTVRRVIPARYETVTEQVLAGSH